MDAQDVKFTTTKDIIVEAIARLRKNKGCDIEFENFREDCNQPWGDPLTLSVCFLRLKFHGQNLELALHGNIFTDTSPNTQEEANILLGTKDIYKMLVLRIAKIIYEHYKNWLKKQGLASKISTALSASTPVYTDTSSLTQSVITNLQDDLEKEKQKNRDLQVRFNALESLLKMKGIL